MKRILATSLLLLPMAAAAGGVNFGGHGGQGGNANAFSAPSSSARSNANSNASARSSQRQGQSQSTYQAQGFVGLNGQSLSGVGQGNTTVVGGSSYDAASIPPIAPNVYPGNPTAPCIVTYGASGGLAAVSVGVSGFTRDSVCTWGEVARVAKESGRLDVANQALALMFAEAEAQTGTAERLNEEIAQAHPVATSDDGFSGLDAMAEE